MKKILLLTLFVLTSVISFSQFKVTKDTTGVDTTRGKGLFYKPKKKTSPFSADFGVASTNLWRGTDVGKQTGIMLIADPGRPKSAVVTSVRRGIIGERHDKSAPWI